MIGQDPSKFFDVSCLPSGFKLQDPSRLGMSVKLLLNHLRERQEQLGVNAFCFQNILRNSKLVPAEYPSNPVNETDNQTAEAAEDQKADPTTGSALELASTSQTPSPSKSPRKKSTKRKHTEVDLLESASTMSSAAAAPINISIPSYGASSFLHSTAPQVLPNIASSSTQTTAGDTSTIPSLPVPSPAQPPELPHFNPFFQYGYPYHPHFPPYPMPQNNSIPQISDFNAPPSGDPFRNVNGNNPFTNLHIDPALLPSQYPPFALPPLPLPSPPLPMVTGLPVAGHLKDEINDISSTTTTPSRKGKRTPKRKRTSFDAQEDIVTPSRSGRRRKLTQKVLDAMQKE